MLDLSLHLKHFVYQVSMKAHSKRFITKSIGIVLELLAWRMLFVCFILIFTTSHDIDTTDILCKFLRYGFEH